MRTALSEQTIIRQIMVVRGQRILLDVHLASLYGVETKQLKRAVRRNAERFPADFMFELTEKELAGLRCQLGTSNRGGVRYRPMAFTEQGIAMLSSVLRSRRAVEVNIEVMRAFVQLRHFVMDNDALRFAITGLEQRMSRNERDIQIALKALQSLLEPQQDPKPNRRMGFGPRE